MSCTVNIKASNGLAAQPAKVLEVLFLPIYSAPEELI